MYMYAYMRQWMHFDFTTPPTRNSCAYATQICHNGREGDGKLETLKIAENAPQAKTISWVVSITLSQLNDVTRAVLDALWFANISSETRSSCYRWEARASASGNKLVHFVTWRGTFHSSRTCVLSSVLVNVISTSHLSTTLWRVRALRESLVTCQLEASVASLFVRSGLWVAQSRRNWGT